LDGAVGVRRAAKVVFGFAIEGGMVVEIEILADPAHLG
jgi:hypothetical protein